VITRLLAALTAALIVLGGGSTAVAAAPSAAADDLWPYPQACTNVTFSNERGVLRPDSEDWAMWFDATLRGRSTPCRRDEGESALAITQYHVRDGVAVGLMSAPWLTAARGGTPFHRTGRIEPDIAAFCISTGLTGRDGGVYAENAQCVRPERSGTDHLITDFAPIAVTDPLVNAALTTYPVDEPALDAQCLGQCLVSPFVLEWPGEQQETTRDTPREGPVEPLSAFTSECHTTSITDTFAGPSDRNINGYDVWMTGSVEGCDPAGQTASIYGIRYWPDRGIVMEPWDLAPDPLVKHATVNENTGALCLASGFREQGGELYGIHDLCWQVRKTQPDVYKLVPISPTDLRVRKPLQSNIPPRDPENPPGACASCL
jgi:hypothetical protein